MRGVAYWLRAWSLRRCLGLALVAVVAAVTLGFVLLAALGARRADTAWEQLRAHARAEDLLLDTATLQGARDLTRSLRREPGVAGTAATAYAYIVPEGRLEDFFGGTILSLDRAASERFWRPVLIEGRRADPTRVDEAVVNADFVAETGRSVGDQVVLVDPFGLIRQRVTIVGVSVMPLDFTFGAASPLAFTTPAFVRKWAGELREAEGRGGATIVPGVLVRGARGSDPLRLAGDLVRAAGPGQVRGVTPADSSSALVVGTLEFQRNGYLALGVVALAAGSAVVALVLARVARLQPAEVVALRTLGFTRRDRRLAVLVPGLAVAIVGAVGAVVLASALEGLVPTGLAGRVGADRSLGDDWGLVALGGLAGALVMGAIAALVARPSSGARASMSTGRDLRLPLLRWPALAVGLRAAGGGRSRAGRLQALAGVSVVVVSVVGIVAMAVVNASRSFLYEHPSLSGVVHDVDVATYNDPSLVRSDRARLVASSSITALATIEAVIPTVDDVGLEAIVVESDRGSFAPPVLDGRRPRAPDEVALTPSSVALLDKGIGDRLELGGPSRTRPFVITGVVAVPYVGASATGEQLLLTPAGRDAVGLEPTAFALVMDVRDPAAVDAVRAPNDDIEACTPKLLPLLGVERLPGARAAGIVPCSPRLDERASNLRELGAVPALVTAFLVVLGGAGLAVLLGGSVRRTGRDLAVLRALGFTRRQVGAAALVQGAAVTVVGAVLALPLGIALGRWIWRLTIDDLGLVEHIVVPGAVLTGVALMAVVLGLVVSSIPAARVARGSVGSELRVE